MTNVFLFLGIGCGVAYVIFLVRPSFREQKVAPVESMAERKAAAYCFYGALLSLLVFVYLSTRKVLWVILAVPLIYLVQIIIQIVAGAAIRAIYKKQ